MVATEKRTLEIVAKVVDFATRPLLGVTRSLQKFAVDGTRHIGGMVRNVVSLRTALAGLAIGFAALKGGGAFNGIVEANAELAKLARGTGASADRLLVLKDALGLAGVEGGRFRTLMTSLTKAVGQALNDGTAKSADALGKLGLTLEDLRTTDPVDLFDRLANSLERFATPQEKAAAILEVFPKATGDIELLVDALGKGQDEFRNLLATARFFGGELSSGSIASIERMADAMDLLQLSIAGVGRTAVARLAEQFAPTIERLATFIAQNRETIASGVAAVTAVIGKAVIYITAAFVRLTAFLSANGSKLIESLEEIPLVGSKIAEGLRDIFNVPTLSADARKIRDEMAATAKAIVDLDRQIAFRSSSGDIPDEGLHQRRIEALKAERERLEGDLRAREGDLLVAGGGPGAAQAQLEAARAGDFADTLRNLTSFDSLPAPPTDLAPITKALFGADGADAAQAKVRSFTAGVADGLERVAQRWTDFGAAGEEAVDRIVDGGLNQLTDSITDVITGVKSAQEAFREFARMLITEVIRMTVRLLIMAAIMAATGLGPAAGAAGGLGGFEDGGQTDRAVVGTVPLRRFERGGVVREPTIALFGEGRASRGEAFVPLPDGRRIPVAMQGANGGGVVHITIHAMDGADVQRVLFENRETISAIWTQEASTRSGVRQTIRGAV